MALLLLALACSGSGFTSVPEGELELRQLLLPGPVPGEAMLITGPTGIRLLLDVGNDSHAGRVLDRLGEPRVALVVLTHFDQDHAGGLEKLERKGLEIEQVLDRYSLCEAGSCQLPWTFDLGDGAELVVLGADGEVSGGARMELPLDEENARSLVGLVRWGGFQYVWAGDLTGGGKGTPDVESFVAAQGVLPVEGASVLHLNHHGISSSGSEAWMDALVRPHTIGLVGANRGYLDAPSTEQLQAFGARSEECVHVPRTGWLGGGEGTCVWGEDVVVRVREDGESFGTWGE